MNHFGIAHHAFHIVAIHMKLLLLILKKDKFLSFQTLKLINFINRCDDCEFPKMTNVLLFQILIF